MSGIRVVIDMGDREAEFTHELLRVGGRSGIDQAERLWRRVTMEINAWFAAAREAEQIDKSKGKEKE